MRWFRFYDEVLDDPKVQQLPAAQFRRKLIAALNGETNEFTPFIRPDSGRLPAHEWRVVRERVFKRDDYTCRVCGERGGRLECDHIVPVARGGGHDDANLQTLCRPCNRRKWAH